MFALDKVFHLPYFVFPILSPAKVCISGSAHSPHQHIPAHVRFSIVVFVEGEIGAHLWHVSVLGFEQDATLDPVLYLCLWLITLPPVRLALYLLFHLLSLNHFVRFLTGRDHGGVDFWARGIRLIHLLGVGVYLFHAEFYLAVDYSAEDEPVHFIEKG